MKGQPGRLYQVKEAARLAGVTVRTLHHYDRIGLLQPAARSASGYRLYGQADLERLQHILVWRALGLSLSDIHVLLSAAHKTRRSILESQHTRLRAERDRLSHMLTAIERSLVHLDEETDMPADTMFDGFHSKPYEDEAAARWGDTEAFKTSQKRTKAYTAADWTAIKADMAAIDAAFAQAMADGVPADAPAAQDIARRHRGHIDRWFYPCAPAMHRMLAASYVSDPRFMAHYEARASGLAQYVHDAVCAAAAVDAQAAPGA